MIFVYPGTEQKNVQTIQKILKGYPIGWIGDRHKDQTLGALLQNESQDEYGLEQAQGEDLPFIYFSGVSIPEVGRIQKELEEAGLNIRSTAIETENNKNFVLKDLMDEVGREARYFEKRDELADLIMAANPVRMKQDADYFKCHYMAASLLQEDELSEKMLDTAIEILKSFQNGK